MASIEACKNLSTKFDVVTGEIYGAAISGGEGGGMKENVGGTSNP
jgi:hypothetical protein